MEILQYKKGRALVSDKEDVCLYLKDQCKQYAIATLT